MSGMKFRINCGDCGAVFFSPDRRARYCPKCAKKRPAAPAPKPGFAREAKPFTKPAKPQKEKNPLRAAELTPELRERLLQLYAERYEGRIFVRKEMVGELAKELWVKHQAVSAALPNGNRRVEPSPALREQIATMFRGYVERGERPAEGRRRSIARVLSVPFETVRRVVYESLLAEGTEFSGGQLSRVQLFEIEKLYFAELAQARYPLAEVIARVAEQSGFAMTAQVQRWLDHLHDDEAPFARVPDATPEQQARILAAYRDYLAAAAPPEKGLHLTIATALGEVTQKQVNKVLLAYRWQLRRNYPRP